MFLNKNLCFGISNILRRGGLLELRLKQLAIIKTQHSSHCLLSKRREFREVNLLT